MKFSDCIEKNMDKITKLANDHDITIISAYKDDCSEKENEERHSQMKEDIRNIGSLVTELCGIYEYDDNISVEKYLAILYINEDKLKDVLERYEQSSYVFVNKEGYKIKDIMNETKNIGSLNDVMQRFHIKDREAFERYTSYILECEGKKIFGESRDLNESSLSRIYKHTKNLDSWSILTSYLDDNSKKENIETYKKLEHDVRSMGLGFIKLQGVGQEKDRKTGEVTEVEEKSMFIPKITKKQAEKIAKKYNQTAFVYYGPETDYDISLVWTDNDKIDKIGKFHPGKIAQFYSKIKGRPFVFESVISKSWFEGLSRSIRRKGVR